MPGSQQAAEESLLSVMFSNDTELWEPRPSPRLDSIQFCSSVLVDITDFTWMSVRRITAREGCQRAGEQLSAEVMEESRSALAGAPAAGRLSLPLQELQELGNVV